ncbi:MAG: ATP-binding cassette domain-containing protein [Deltaproteobacteria bacterium]|nr:MAG: ATP-binding cassette domain-containing protein [Deltaproteobacteria bacterium]
MKPAEVAIRIDGVSYDYGSRRALDAVRFDVAEGEIFGLLGPNGGGKTTLFRILSTLVEPQVGRIHVFGYDVRTEQAAVRAQMGVVFQHPSVDGKLTVAENLKHHGRLYGLSGRELRERSEQALARVGLSDRRDDRVETLSGGQQRRVELAKGLLTRPRLLVLDEPSTGLDPGARRELWRYLRDVRSEYGATVLVTTHLMDEAELCDRLAILDHGRVVAEGAPAELRAEIGGDVVSLSCEDPDDLAARIEQRFGKRPMRVDTALRLEIPDGHLFIGRVVEAFGDSISEISLAKPTLEDVFIHQTGHRFWDEQ